MTIGVELKPNPHLNFEILEKNLNCGGLCQSFTEEGFTFDYGGAHIIYSMNQVLIDFMPRTLGENCHPGKRNNKI